MDHEEILTAMRGVVEAPGYPLLKGYKTDFYEHDVRQIRNSWASGSQFLWVVREYGTHLAHIGVHAKLNEYASAAISVAVTSGSPYEIYHLSAKGVRKLTLEAARLLLVVMQYVTQDHRVMDASGKVVAAFTVERVATGTTQSGIVRFTTAHDVIRTPSFLAALNQIAMGEVVKAWGSWFCSVQAVEVDGRDIAPLLNESEVADIALV